MGMEALAASSRDEYVNLAVRLALEPDFRQEMHREICERCEVLFEDVTVVREYEEFFESVVDIS